MQRYTDTATGILDPRRHGGTIGVLRLRTGHGSNVELNIKPLDLKPGARVEIPIWPMASTGVAGYGVNVLIKRIELSLADR